MQTWMISDISSYVWVAFAVFLRIGPAIALTPGFGENSVSVRVKLSLGLAVSLAIVPLVEHQIPKDLETIADFSLFSLRETIIGSFIGLFARGVILLLSLAGSVISQSVSLAQITGNMTEAMPTIGHILTVTGVALFFSGPLIEYVIRFFLLSYHVDVELFGEGFADFAERSAELLNYVFINGTLLASAFVALFFVYYLFTGFLNKTMPQFMVSFIGVPFVALFSIFYLYKTSEHMLTVWQKKAIGLLLIPFDALQ